jgi:putative spermidine/putrescine transport system permease protein
MESKLARWLIRIGSGFTLLFLYVPIFIVVIYAFNNSIGQKWPITDFTTKWFGVTWHSPLVRSALTNSLYVGALATLIALLLGSAAAFAVHRFAFFGRSAISFALVLPIALPGIVTAIALNSAINTFQIPFSL